MIMKKKPGPKSKLQKRNIGQKQQLPQKASLQPFTDKILAAHNKFMDADRKTSIYAVEVGDELRRTKDMVKSTKCSWLLYIQCELSDLAQYQIRDYMYLSSRYEENSLPGLLWINQTNLIRFYRLCKGKPAKKVLAAKHIDIIGKDATPDEVRSFQKKILELLRPVNTASNHKDIAKSDQLNVNPSDTQDNPRLFYRKALLNIIKAELEESEDDLKPFSPKALKNWKLFSKSILAYIKRRTPQSEEDL